MQPWVASGSFRILLTPVIPDLRCTRSFVLPARVSDERAGTLGHSARGLPQRGNGVVARNRLRAIIVARSRR